MADPRISLKSPIFAALLAFLIPGAGHLYQGRFFKAAIFAVCILGAFAYGMHAAEWQAVYRSADPQKRNLGYYAQAATGLPALYAIVQTRRFEDQRNEPSNLLKEPISSPFEGELRIPGRHDVAEHVEGHLQLEPTVGQQGGTVRGTLEATLENGETVKYAIGGSDFSLEPKVGGNPQRTIHCEVVEEQEGGRSQTIGVLDGYIPRKFADWFEAPLQENELQDLNRRLGKRYELALIYTWIAGLLNILAVWDALEGPAYGYGDEEEDEASGGEKKKQPEKKPTEKKLEPAKS